jgi:hypothetical protein
MGNNESNIGKDARTTARYLLRDLALYRGHEVSCEFFVYLLPTGFQLFDPVLRSKWMPDVVVHHLGVTIKAQWYGIVNAVTTSLVCRHKMMNFNIDTAGLLAEAAMTITPQQNLGPHVLVECHESSLLAVAHSRSLSVCTSVRHSMVVALEAILQFFCNIGKSVFASANLPKSLIAFH